MLRSLALGEWAPQTKQQEAGAAAVTSLEGITKK